MALAKATLGTSITDVYTSVNDSATTSIFFTNDAVGGKTIDVHLVANGDTADATNRIIKPTKGNIYIDDKRNEYLSNISKEEYI